ncbi:MAG: radical SAM protein [Candidatus Bathyarchaeota archaeon]
MKTGQIVAKTLSAFVKFKVKKSIPLFASYNVTGRCNMRCIFCNWWKNEIPELSTKKALEAIDTVCGLGVPFFDLSGGEPLLRKDLATLAKRATDHGCLVSMNTNGTLLNEKRIKELTNVLDMVVVSLDGPKEVHDKIRGVSGTFDRAINAIKLLKENGMKVGVNSVVTPWNIDFLPKFIEELHEIVDFAQIQPIHPYPPTPENVPENDQISKLVSYLLKLKKSNPSFLAEPKNFLEGFYDFFKGKARKICHAGELYVAINPSGKLLACPARSDIILGDIFSCSINKLLKNKQESKDWYKVSSCKGCWLECTAGVSMVLENPLKETSQLAGLLKPK